MGEQVLVMLLKFFLRGEKEREGGSHFGCFDVKS